MHAALLFSATLHVAALGLLAAWALKRWTGMRRPKEMSLHEHVTAAGALGLCVALAVTVLMWLARPFGAALATGLAGGVVAALAFLLALGAWPAEPLSFGEGPSVASRRAAAVGIGLCVMTELVAFCLLVAAAGVGRA